MTDAPRTDAPATVAPQRHLLPRLRSSLNQNQNSLSVSPSPTPTSSSSSTPSPSLRLAPTPPTIRRASVVGEQVSQGSKCRWGASVPGATVVLPFLTIFINIIHTEIVMIAVKIVEIFRNVESYYT
jgi:hypothetical protein